MGTWYDTRYVDDVRPGDHAWLPYSGAEERDHVVAPFVAGALATNEKIVYVTDAPAARLPGMSAFDPAAFAATGQLRVLTRAESCLDAAGGFDPDRLGRTIDREVARGFEAGFRAVRFTTDFTWLLAAGADLTGLLGCEDRLAHAVSPSTVAMAVCQIDRRRCPPDRLVELGATHEVRVEGNPLFDDGTLRIARSFAPRGLRIEGELDRARHAVFAEHLGRLLAGRRGVHLDCGGLGFLDLGGLNLLVRHALALPRGEALILDDLPANVENVIDMVGWNRLPGLVPGRARGARDGGATAWA
ncbi:MEDS domain-containing protein [Actinomadura rayongensis]|uniref:STAS domain-containing protein n=1 Tax=Actinomadura rayongensis TaxID=1429076 RepID=A0A6I4W807_9ACTN|nr:MEDS domain-containing protein [Actinomadura rayongensis]MXQ62862.1 STAS domain-containing protein [Actinomadura rayongensis]